MYGHEAKETLKGNPPNLTKRVTITLDQKQSERFRKADFEGKVAILACYLYEQERNKE